jgi:hypothetical protein
MITKERAIKIMAMRPLADHEIPVLRELIDGPKSDACDQIGAILLKRAISPAEAEFLLGLLGAPPTTQLEPQECEYPFDDETVDIFESVNAELEQKLLALAIYATKLEEAMDEMAKKVPDGYRISLRTISNTTGQGVPSGMLHCDGCRTIMPFTGTNGSYDICPHCKAEQAPF